jgi:hypothetical protein
MAFIGSTTPLVGSDVFTSVAKVDGFTKIRGIVHSDESGSLVISHSADGVNWDVAETAITVTGGTGEAIDFTLLGSYFKIVYTNGATDQGEFRLWVKSYG